MMETLTLRSVSNQNNQTLHVAVAELLDIHNHLPVDEEQMINLSDITDFSQEDIVTMPMAKEILLISLVSKEQALYNPKHENYRNTQRKDLKWLEISEHIGWTELQCKAKWKAMRDQYCRELKRSKFNNKANVKWKYFKELEFLRPYALARNYRPRLPPAVNNSQNSSNNFICTSVNPNDLGNSAGDVDSSPSKFSTIKIEGTTTLNFTCDFSSSKSDTSNNITEEQLSSVLQQTDDHNWTYITGSNNSSTNNTSLENHTLNDNQHLLTSNHHNTDQRQHQQSTSDEAVLYNVLVDCMGQMQESQSSQQTQQHQREQPQLCQQQQSNANNDEEDEDPIHTFLNIESYFEKELIALVRSEDMLYNNYNPNYRNVKLKLVVWGQIARKLKKTVRQCRLKWKALRDQFIREHKRLKDLENIEALPKWKHYEALGFLKAFIKHKGDCNPRLTLPSDFESNKNLLEISKTKLEPDTDDNSNSPLRSPLQQMTVVNNGRRLQQQTNHTNNMCVNTASVGAYDDMDIENYIIGDSGSVVDEHNGTEDNEHDSEDRKSQQEFSVFSNHNTNLSNDMGAATLEPTTQTFKEEHTQLQQQHQSEQQQPEPINMPTLDLNDATPNNLLSDNLNCSPASKSNSNNSYQHQNLLASGGNITLASAVTTLDMCTSTGRMPTLTERPSSSATHQPPSTSEASTNTQPLQDNINCSYSNATNITNNSNANANNSDEDEVGAFFKAVAMKIRNANLSQVALTDLEIEILRVINTSLRNH